jgi:predicted RNA-binding protein with TRAM domain
MTTTVQKQPPVREGQELDLTISDVSRRGDSGIARVNGFVVFVPGAQPGEKVHVRIVRVKPNYALAAVTDENET